MFLQSESENTFQYSVSCQAPPLPEPCPLRILYGFPAWYPDVSMLKKLENFQRSCFLWIFGRKSFYLKQVKDNNFLPLCYQLEYITFSFLSQLMLDKYNYDHSQYVVFKEPSRFARIIHKCPAIKEPP